MDTLRHLDVFLVVVVIAACARARQRQEPTPAIRPTESGQWWQYRGDQWLSGRARIRGTIERPAIRWRHSIAAGESLLAARLDSTGNADAPITADLAGSSPPGTWDQVLQQWNVAGPYGTSWLDLDGTGELVAVTRNPNQKIGKILPEVPGLQLVECEAKGYPKVPGVYKGTVRLKVRQNGQWQTRWEIETETLIWVAEPIFGDFDGDERTEIALLPWFRLNVLDAATGELKEKCNFLAENEHEIPGHGGRAYGWFGAVDVDGDGRQEFVIIEDFIRYATVIGRRDGKLQRLWLNVWEPRTEGGDIRRSRGHGHRSDQSRAGAGRGQRRPEGDRCFAVQRDGRPTMARPRPGPAHRCDEVRPSGPVSHRPARRRWRRPGGGLLHRRGSRPANSRPGDGVDRQFPAGGTAERWSLADASFATCNLGEFPRMSTAARRWAGETILCGPVAPDRPNVFFTRKKTAQPPGRRRFSAGKRTAAAVSSRSPRGLARDLQPLATRAAGQEQTCVLLQAAAMEDEPVAVTCPRRRMRGACAGFPPECGSGLACGGRSAGAGRPADRGRAEGQ